MKATRKKTHFVPKVVFRTAFAGVVPVYVAATGCGGSTAPAGHATGAPDAGPDQFLLGVGCPAFECGVAARSFDASTDAADVADVADAADAADALLFVVACIGFDGGPCGVLPEDATTGDAAAQDGSIHDATADVHEGVSDQ
jgi:hypothetical protein